MLVSSGRKYILYLIGAAACWGVAAAISKRAVTEIPPLTLLPIQLGVSVAGLIVLVRVRGSSWSIGSTRLGLVGAINGVAYLFSLAGLVHITASLSVLLWATEPIIILALAFPLLGERVSKGMTSLFLSALAGVILVVFGPVGGSATVGVLYTLIGVTLCAFYTILARRLLTDDSTVAVVAWQQMAAMGVAVLALAVAAISGTDLALRGVSAAAWISAVVSGILYYAVGFLLYVAALRVTGAATAGLFLNLIPVFGIAAGSLLLDERLQPRQWLGAVLIVGSVGALLWLQRRRTAVTATQVEV